MASENEPDGSLIRKFREIAGISKEELNANLKISIGYIDAIEDEDFNKLKIAREKSLKN